MVTKLLFRKWECFPFRVKTWRRDAFALFSPGTARQCSERLIPVLPPEVLPNMENNEIVAS